MILTERPDGRPELPLDPDAPALHLRPAGIGLVAVGGVVGTLSRYGLAVLAPSRAGSWPWGTFTANMVGALVLGALLEALARSGPDEGWRQRARLLVGTGFCGGLTTYSTFATEADLLVRSHDSGLAVAYLATSVIGGLLATVAGIAVAARWRRSS
jgi:fluoride exporter